MPYCNRCQIESLDDANFCRGCGEKFTDESFKIKIDKIVCIKCDNLNPIDTKFCEQCGEVIVINAETELKSILVSALLEEHERTREDNIRIEEGSNSDMMESEAQQIYLEAEKRKEKFLKVLEYGLEKTEDRNIIELINDRIEDTKKNLESLKELIKETEDNSAVCPYCKREIELDGGMQDKDIEMKCGLCHKDFKCITGVVKIIRGNTNAKVQYGPEPISITLEQGDREKSINFKTRSRFLISRGDRISIFYIKGFLSKSLNEYPHIIYNQSSDEGYKV